MNRSDLFSCGTVVDPDVTAFSLATQIHPMCLGSRAFSLPKCTFSSHLNMMVFIIHVCLFTGSQLWVIPQIAKPICGLLSPITWWVERNFLRLFILKAFYGVLI